jgi:hypothetical protein
LKKLLTVLCGVIIALSLFVTTGNTVKAADCGCDVSPVLGAEKNKIIANLLSSQKFKDTKHTIFEEGYKWRGASNIEVMVNHTHGDALMIGIPFYTKDGSIVMAVYINGVYMGLVPNE